MAEPLAVERRVKVSVTVSPVLLREVDRFVAEHSGTDRSKVFNEALRLWHDQQLEEAIAAQHRAPMSPEERAEHEAWRAIQTAAAARIFGGDR